LVINVGFSFRLGLSLYRFLKIVEGILLIIYWRKKFSPDLLLPLFFGLLLVSVLAWWQFISQSSVGGIFWWLGERAFNPATLGVAKINLGNRLLVRPMATFSHANSLAGFVLVCLVVFSRFGHFLKKKLGRFFYWGWGFIASTLLISFSAGAWLAILVAIFLLISRQRPSGQGLVIFVFLVGLMTILLFYGGLIDSHSLVERLKLLINAGELFQLRPLIGWGLGNFIPAQEKLSFSRFDFNYYQPVHNLLALIAVETGISGLAIGLYWWQRLWSKIDWFWRRLLMVILVLGCFDHYWLTLQQNFLLGGIVVSVALYQAKSH
jgi:O-antigen ligase